MIETGRGLATDPATFLVLLDTTIMVWVRAASEEHL
jgi:hypothetical protein